jgi:hypothetical protein
MKQRIKKLSELEREEKLQELLKNDELKKLYQNCLRNDKKPFYVGGPNRLGRPLSEFIRYCALQKSVNNIFLWGFYLDECTLQLNIKDYKVIGVNKKTLIDGISYLNMNNYALVGFIYEEDESVLLNMTSEEILKRVGVIVINSDGTELNYYDQTDDYADDGFTVDEN